LEVQLELITISMVHCLTDLLRDALAYPDGDPLVLQMTDFLGKVLALGDGFILTGLVGDLVALLPVHVVTFLLGNSLAHRVGNFLRMSLLHVVTFVIWIPLTTPFNWGPDLLFTNNLPLVFAVILVVGNALSLGVRLHHCLVFLHTDLLVFLDTDLVLHKVTLLLGDLLAQPLALHLANLLVNSLALLVCLLHVLGVPDSGVLHSAVHGTFALHKLLRGAIRDSRDSRDCRDSRDNRVSRDCSDCKGRRRRRVGGGGGIIWQGRAQGDYHC